MADPKKAARDSIRPEVARQIDENLRRLYVDTASETLPDSLTDLLAALRDKENDAGGGEN